MKAGNPLLVETWRGLLGASDTRNPWLGYLALQALALLLWWPWGDESRFVVSQSEPMALLAVVIALGATLSLYSIRAGAEEILLPGQHPLHEWLVATPLGTARILGGYLAGHLLQSSHLVLLSLPLVLAGFAVSSAEWQGLAWSLAAVVLMSCFFRVTGALLYLTIGHRGTGIFMLLRVTVVACYAIAPLVLPAASHPLLAHALLVETDPARFAIGALPAQQVFTAVYGAGVVLATMALYRVMSKQRNAAGVSSSASGRSGAGGSS